MLGVTVILALISPAWAGKCKVDWTRSGVELQSGRSTFDVEGRPLQVRAGGLDMSLEWSEGLVRLDSPDRTTRVEWEQGRPVLVQTDEARARTEDRWAWAGGEVGSWSRCRWVDGEEQPCVETTFAYDPQARLVRVSDPSGSHLLRWEGEALVEHTWPQSGTVHRLTWDGSGRLESLTEEAGEISVTETYTRDEAGRIVRREVRSAEILLEAEVAEYDRALLTRVGRVEGEDTVWTRVLTWDEDQPVGMITASGSTTWAWKGPCEQAVRNLVRHLGLVQAEPLPAYLAPWTSPDLQAGAPWVPSDLPGPAGLNR